MPWTARSPSSSQSDTGQPVVAPSDAPRHQGATEPSGWSATTLSVRSTSSSQVVGTSYPARSKATGEYQTKDLTLAMSGAP